MSNFSVLEAGSPSEWAHLRFEHPAFEKPVRGKFFLAEALGLSSMEASLNSLPPRVAMPFVHAHREYEELYVFLSGTGEMLLDGELVPVQAGSCVRVAPEGKRSWRNTGDDSLVYLVIQARSGSLGPKTIADGVPVPGPVPWPETRSE